jgi:hypothetical protein
VSRSNKAILDRNEPGDEENQNVGVIDHANYASAENNERRTGCWSTIAERRAKIQEGRLEVENVLDQIIRLLMSRKRMKSNAIAGTLRIHTDTVARALKAGFERGCIVRLQIEGALRNYFEYDLSDGTRQYLLKIGQNFK